MDVANATTFAENSTNISADEQLLLETMTYMEYKIGRLVYSIKGKNRMDTLTCPILAPLTPLFWIFARSFSDLPILPLFQKERDVFSEA